MSLRAWSHVLIVLLVGATLSGLALLAPLPSLDQWWTCLVLIVLTTIAQQFEAMLGRQSFYPSMVFLFGGALLLPPSLFVLLVAIPHAIELAKKRICGSPYLRDWYIQPFNISVHIIAGTLAHQVYFGLAGDVPLVALSAMLAAIVAAGGYILLNHFLVAHALVLARGASWDGSGVLNVESLAAELTLCALGYLVAAFWHLAPWLVVLVIAPLALLYQALRVPELKQEAQTDSKTNLLNARYFNQALATEFGRAQRFGRPLTILMADLDLLRNINNTYGHLAGDAVLAGVGKIIRASIRESDLAGRFGGEEFAIALPETERSEGFVIADRLRRAVASTAFETALSPDPISATMSIGVAAYPADGDDLEALIHAADVAVYQAKYLGRNRVICAADVPHSIRLEQLTGKTLVTPPASTGAEAGQDDRVMAQASGETGMSSDSIDQEKHVAAIEYQAIKPMAVNGPPQPSLAPKAAAHAVDQPQPFARPRSSHRAGTMLWLHVGGVIGLGIVVTLLGIAIGPPPMLMTIGLLALLAALAEVFQIDVYGSNTVSVSVAFAFTAALIAGIPGLACVSAAIAGTHALRRRSPLYRAAYNWATHLLAGFVTALAAKLLTIPLQLDFLPFLIGPMMVLALTYYLMDTGLVAAAISLSSGARLLTIWRQQFRWLASHYLVLCGFGLFMSIAFMMQGIAGLVICIIPLVMMRYAQQQYVTRTEESVGELKRMNHELSQANQTVVDANNAIHKLNDELKSLNESLFLTLGMILDARDPYVSGHAAQVANYAWAVATELGLPIEQAELVRQAGFLHDIGKIAISEQILNKPDKLTEDEYETLKAHTVVGAQLIEASKGLSHLAPFIRYHHERWDGRGYPEGLRGEEIPLEARILNVCDSVEAMASDRPYKRSMVPSQILLEVQRCSGAQFDPRVTEAFLQVVQREGEHFIINSAATVQHQRHRYRLDLPGTTMPRQYIMLSSQRRMVG